MASRAPRMMRSLASSMSWAVTTSRSWRTATIAASLSRLARSAPEKPGVARADRVEVHVGSEMLLVRVHLQDRGTLSLVGERDLDLAVEPARTQQGRVEHLGAVRGGHDDDPRLRVEAVHLGQELVQRLLAFVVRDDRTASLLPDGVDLVDEDDRGRPLAGVVEEVAYP